jgi:hypothetical protein
MFSLFQAITYASTNFISDSKLLKAIGMSSNQKHSAKKMRKRRKKQGEHSRKIRHQGRKRRRGQSMLQLKTENVIRRGNKWRLLLRLLRLLLKTSYHFQLIHIHEVLRTGKGKNPREWGIFRKTGKHLEYCSDHCILDKRMKYEAWRVVHKGAL